MKRVIIISLTLLIFNATANSQSKIDKAEESLKKSNKTKSNQSTNYTYNNEINNDSENNFITDIIGGLFIKFFAYTAYGIAFESPFEMKHKGSNSFLTKHPYKNTTTGNYSYEWNRDTEIFTTSITNKFVFETNKVYGNHLNIDMRFLKQFGFELDYLQFMGREYKFRKQCISYLHSFG